MFKLAKYLKPYWWQVIILLASVAVQVWASLQLPALMADIVNDGIVAGDLDFVWHTGFIMVGFALLTAVGAFLSGLLSARIGSAFARDVRADFFRQVLSFSISDISDFSTASLITRTTNDISQVQQTIIMCLSMALRAPMTCVIAIIPDDLRDCHHPSRRHRAQYDLDYRYRRWRHPLPYDSGDGDCDA